jgi:hypothetical protein
MKKMDLFTSLLLMVSFVTQDFIIIMGQATPRPTRDPATPYNICGYLPDREFFVVKKKVKKSQADVLCANVGGQLARITSATDQAAANVAIGSSGYEPWIGLTDPAKNRTFSYPGISELFYPDDDGCYENWSNAEPNHSDPRGEYCVQINYKHKWNDVNCDVNFYYPLCERIITNAPTKSPTKSHPTRSPTRHPTSKPTTQKPTHRPTTKGPTRTPTQKPSHRPTTKGPTRAPTTRKPTMTPS